MKEALTVVTIGILALFFFGGLYYCLESSWEDRRELYNREARRLHLNELSRDDSKLLGLPQMTQMYMELKARK